MKELSVVSRISAAIALTALVLIAGRLLIPESAGAQPGQDCAQIAADAAARNRVVDGVGSRTIAVLGDSYAQGYGLVDQRDSWTRSLAADLHSRVVTRSLGGTGFAASPCGAGSYADRAASVPKNADLVIVEGGLNDVLASDRAIRQGVRATIAATGAERTVIVGPADAPRWTAEAHRVDQILEAICAELGVRYISAVDWPLKFGPDKIHLAPASHAVFAQRVADALS